MKKVLFLSFRLGYSSLIYWDNILSSLKKEFKSLRVFTAWSPLSTKDKTVTTEKKLKGIKHYTNVNKINQKLYFLPLPFFLKDIIAYKPEVIVLNEFNLVNFYTLFFRFLYRKTKVLLLVESDPFMGQPFPLKYSIRKFYRQYIVKKVDKILTNNTIGKKYLINYLNAPVEKIVVKPYLASYPDGTYIPKDKEKQMVNFLYVGQLVEGKGLKFLLKVLKSLSKEETKYMHFDIVGGGELYDFIQNFIQKENLDFVTCHGLVPFTEISKFYNNADCFVLPTLLDYRALVGFEALHYGCAMIESVYDGAKFEVVEEGKNGYIIDPRNLEKFKKAILILAQDREKRIQFQAKSLEKSQKFTYDICNGNIINTIKEL